jgi:uncharacterized membrane protein
MKANKEVDELLKAGIIDQATAERITNYYATKTSTPQSKLLIVFGILGALLVSLGIILILAHNWDQLTRITKTVISFLPLLIGQALCAFTLWKKQHSTGWRESSSVFLFFAIGASLSLISQIYNIPGQISSFMLTWMLLALPIIYVMNSSTASLFYLAGITYYACEVGYWGSTEGTPLLFWGLLLLALPHYYMLYRNKSDSNFFHLHNWFIPLSVIITLGTLATDWSELMFVAYMSLFGLIYQIGHFRILEEGHVRNNGYLVLGSLGTVALLLFLSFDIFWSDWREEGFPEHWMNTPEFLVSVVLTISALALLIYQKFRQPKFNLQPVEWVFLVFAGLFFLGMSSPYVIIWINIIILAIAILTIREGAIKNHFGILNYGLLIIAALVICRFFDSDIGFVLKGILFVLVGAGFFFANNWMIRKKKSTTINPSV